MKKQISTISAATILSVALLSPAFGQISAEDAQMLIINLAAQQTPPQMIVATLIEEGFSLDEAVDMLSDLSQTDSPDDLITAMMDFGMSADEAAVVVTANNNTGTDQTQSRAARLRSDGLTVQVATGLVVAITTSTTTTQRLDSLMRQGIPVNEASGYITRLTLTATPAQVFQSIASSGVPINRAAEIMSINSRNTTANDLLDTFVSQGVDVATAANLIVANQATAAVAANPQQLNPALQTALVNDPNPAQPQLQLQDSTLLTQPALSPATVNNNLLTGSASGGTAVSTSQ